MYTLRRMNIREKQSLIHVNNLVYRVSNITRINDKTQKKRDRTRQKDIETQKRPIRKCSGI